jgi:hypothetical protein
VRLAKVARGEKLFHRLLYRFIRWRSGAEMPGVVKTLLYRRSFWGAPQNEMLQRVMRGPSEWTPGQRELIAMFTSLQFQCPF